MKVEPRIVTRYISLINIYIGIIYIYKHIGIIYIYMIHILIDLPI